MSKIGPREYQILLAISYLNQATKRKAIVASYFPLRKGIDHSQMTYGYKAFNRLIDKGLIKVLREDGEDTLYEVTTVGYWKIRQLERT